MANIISSNHKLFKDKTINDFIEKSVLIARGLDIGCFDKLVLNQDIFSIPKNTILKDSKNCIYESHKEYIDIHIVIEGRETVELIDLKKSTIEPYEVNYENDYFLYRSALTEDKIVLNEMSVAIFGFDDIHKVCIKSRKDDVSVKKVVLKIKQSIFEKEFIGE